MHNVTFCLMPNMLDKALLSIVRKHSSVTSAKVDDILCSYCLTVSFRPAWAGLRKHVKQAGRAKKMANYN